MILKYVWFTMLLNKRLWLTRGRIYKKLNGRHVGTILQLSSKIWFKTLVRQISTYKGNTHQTLINTDTQTLCLWTVPQKQPLLIWSTYIQWKTTEAMTGYVPAILKASAYFVQNIFFSKDHVLWLLPEKTSTSK